MLKLWFICWMLSILFMAIIWFYRERKPKLRKRAVKPVAYSYCETMAAYKWHIRELTHAGKKLGGGADSLTLCGLQAAWDLQIDPVAKDEINHGVCVACWNRWIAL